MSSMNNERDPHITTIVIGTMATSAAKTVPGIYFRKHSRIKNVWYVDQAGIAKSSSNHIAVTLQDLSSNAVAALDTSGAAAVANTQLAMALSTPVGDTSNQPEADVAAGTMLNVAIAGAGTGIPTLAVVLVEWYPL